MSLLFNVLSRLVITFLPRSKHLLISWLHLPSAVILEPKKIKIIASGPITSWQIDGETIEKMTDFIFLGTKITADGDCSHEKKNYDKPRQHIKKQRHYFTEKGLYIQSYGFSGSHVWM